MSPLVHHEGRIIDHHSDATTTGMLPKSEPAPNPKTMTDGNVPAIFVLDPVLFELDNVKTGSYDRREVVKELCTKDEARATVLDDSPSSIPSQLAEDLSLLCLSPEMAMTGGRGDTQADEQGLPGTPMIPPGLSAGETTTTTNTPHVPNQTSSDAVDPAVLRADIERAREEDLRLYSVAGLSPLDVYVLETRLPDELLVHDLHNITGRCPDSRTPVRYVRAKPVTEGPEQYVVSAWATDKAPRNPDVAHLYLAEGNRLGEGHHSTVFQAPFSVRLEGASDTASRVTVAVKTTSAECGAHYMLHQEATMYTSFPRDFMEETHRPSPTLANRVPNAPEQGLADETCLPSPTSALNVAADNDAEHSEPAGDVAPVEHHQLVAGRTQKDRVLPPVVPKFYGYYLPVDDDGNFFGRTHINCKEDGTCDVDWPARLLLIEECGAPIEPEDFTHDQRLECFSLFQRLHEAGFVQYSPYRRNMLVQPGPLSAPRRERSFAAPSFRIIDFGRGENRQIEREDGDARRFTRWVAHDEKWAKGALGLV